MTDAPFPIVITGSVDHGKSTLIGRLFFDTGSLQEERYAEILNSSSELGKSADFAFVLDAFEEERSRGMTIDTSQIFFSSGKRNYLIIDAPGHKEFIRNMVTGASHAEAALLLVDACEGIMPQTCRHVHLLNMLGIKNLCVVVNKMDRVDFDQAIYDGIVAKMAELLSKVGISRATYVPTSALHGINVAKKGTEIEWYAGPTLLEALDTLRFKPLILRSFRFPVQDVYAMDEGSVLVGRIESGEVVRGMELELLPRGGTVRVKEIRKFPEHDLDRAGFGESIGMVLTEDTPVKRGDLLVPLGDTRHCREFAANVFWFSGSYFSGDPVMIRCVTQETSATLDLENKFDPAEIEKRIDNPDSIEIGEIAGVRVYTENDFVVDPFRSIPEMGRFVIEIGGIPVGGGIVL